IHETLYRSTDLVRLDLPRYFGSIISYLERIYHLPDIRISLITDIHPIKLGMDHSIACGLILNELVTNALKYAFPDRDNGVIRILFSMADSHTATLRVSDNGCGTPDMFEAANTESLGLQLVRILAEDQLEGELIITRETELEFSIRFPLTQEE
ncbi:MAG: sensor histidine kinase, partial [Desulfobacterales bacterium]|nr:sensor histidine kinase [Desulfobacterales bacterium]